MTLAELARWACAFVVYALALVFSTATSMAMFWNAGESLWPMVYMLGLPLVVTLLVDRKWFGEKK